MKNADNGEKTRENTLNVLPDLSNEKETRQFIKDNFYYDPATYSFKRSLDYIEYVKKEIESGKLEKEYPVAVVPEFERTSLESLKNVLDKSCESMTAEPTEVYIIQRENPAFLVESEIIYLAAFLNKEKAEAYLKESKEYAAAFEQVYNRTKQVIEHPYDKGFNPKLLNIYSLKTVPVVMS